MKRIGLFFVALLLLCLLFAVGVCAKEINTQVRGTQDITGALEGADSGDTVNITLNSDIDLAQTVQIDKAVTVNVYFNGYTVRYNGTAGKDTTTAAFHISKAGATLNLVGSNPLADYRTYSHYGEDVKADMVGTGNLVAVSFGTVNIKDAYFYATDAFVIYGAFVESANYCVSVESSVLRVNEGAKNSAITYKGGNSYSSSLIKRELNLKNVVEYGGFFGIDHNFNLTRGSRFEGVKFYDFYLRNDCWYDPSIADVRALLMHTFDEALLMKECAFYNSDGTLGNLKIRTETGKQNLKLYNCEYSALEAHEKVTGDRIGNAMLFVIDVPATCVSSGTMHYYINGFAESSKKVNQTIPANGSHTQGEEKITYPNGYCAEGLGIALCPACLENYVTESTYAPIFTSLGYSIHEKSGSVALGTKMNRASYSAFVATNPSAILEYGFIVGDENITVSCKNGEITVENGYFVDLDQGAADGFVIKVTNIKESLYDTRFALEFYIFDGEKIQYAEEGLDLLSYNEIELMLDELTNEVNELLYSKHKLYLNDDGSFRVLIIADAHMNVGGNAEDVQEVKDRIRMLVDRENPNLVIFTGDNTIGSSSEARLRENITALVSYIEEKQIPWCHVYGNHDHEGALSKESQQVIYESFEYCISKTDAADLSGVGNYVHGVYNRDGSLSSVIYLVDSGTYASGGGYDYIKDDQIAWYKSCSELLEEYNGGEVVPGIMAFHIPLIENNTAHNNRNNTDLVYEFDGEKNENICSSATDTLLLETVWERGDIKAIVTGHDHVNTYMYNYLGVKLCSSPNISDLTYFTAAVQGSRVFDLNPATIDDIPTYVSYIIERVNPDKYGALDTNITIEGFEGEMPETGTASLGGGGISGSLTLEIAEGKGANGTSGLKVQRSQTSNSEFYVYFDKESYGKVGENAYLVVWMDFTTMEFRKACVGLLTNSGNTPFMTDNNDGTSPPYYYLADGSDTWVELKHGGDGCFGSAEKSGVLGKRGYFAFKIEDFIKDGARMNGGDLVTGFYMYLDINSSFYADQCFYIDNIILTDDYTTLFN